MITSRTSRLPPLLCALTLALACVNCGAKDSSPDAGDGDAAAAHDGGAIDTHATDGHAADTGVGQDAATVDAGSADTGKDPALAKKMSDLTYETPGQWAAPLVDYFAAADKKLKGTPNDTPYDTAIHDLMPFDGKLYVGFGDAGHDLGQVFPVPMRAFTDPAKPTTTDEFTSAEEQIDRYRVLGDELWVAGVDATEDGWLGNVYRGLAAGKWTKHRTLGGGVHVHDVARHAGSLWAVGSGATQAQWQDGDVYAHLWRSDDDGATMKVAAQAWNNSEGDARWQHLLPTSKGLMVFGFRKDAQGNTAELPHGVVHEAKDGTTSILPLGPTHALKAVFVVGCWPIGDGRGIVTGLSLLKNPKKLESWLVDGDGATPLPLADNAILDVHVEGDEVALLGTAGADYPLKKLGATWTVRAWISSDLAKWQKVLDFPSGDAVTALAWWRGHFYVGSAQGQVWRGAGSWPTP